MEELETGLLGIGEKETDFIMGANDSVTFELLKRENINRQPKYEYNQGAREESRNRCTIVSAFTELSYLFDRECSFSEIKTVADRMILDKKLDPNKGAYLSDAVDYTRRWWNEMFPDQKVVSFQISYLDEELKNMLIHKNCRLTQIGYRTSSELRKELQTNGYAMGKDYPKIGGHAVSQYGLNTIDNYKGQNKFNRYSFHYFNDLIKNGVIFEKGYMFLKAE